MRVLQSYQDDEVDKLIDRLYAKILELENSTLHKIDIIYNIMKQHCTQAAQGKRLLDNTIPSGVRRCCVKDVFQEALVAQLVRALCL